MFRLIVMLYQYRAQRDRHAMCERSKRTRSSSRGYPLTHEQDRSEPRVWPHNSHTDLRRTVYSQYVEATERAHALVKRSTPTVDIRRLH